MVFLSRCTERRWQGRGKSSYDLQLPDDLVPEPSPRGDVAVDEERRLFYVASTRARDRLVYTWARSYPQPSSEEACTSFLTMAMSLRGGAVLSKDVPVESSLSVRPPRPAGQPVLQRLSIAVSDLAVFRSCPRRYDYLRRWHLPVRTDARTWYGTMIHEVLRSAATRRMSGEDISADAVASMWQRPGSSRKGQRGAMRTCARMARNSYAATSSHPGWIDTIIDQVESRSSSRSTTRTRPVASTVSTIESDGIPTVVDYKTGRPKDEVALRADLQLRAYAVGLAQREQADEVAVEFHYLQGAVTRVIADKGLLRRAHGHLSATARELATARARGRSRRSRHGGSVSAATSARCVMRGGPRRWRTDGGPLGSDPSGGRNEKGGLRAALPFLKPMLGYGMLMVQSPRPCVAASTEPAPGLSRRSFTEVFGRFDPSRDHAVWTPPPALAMKAPMSVASMSIPSAKTSASLGTSGRLPEMFFQVVPPFVGLEHMADTATRDPAARIAVVDGKHVRGLVGSTVRPAIKRPGRFDA